MSYSLNSLKGLKEGHYIGDSKGRFRGILGVETMAHMRLSEKGL